MASQQAAEVGDFPPAPLSVPSLEPLSISARREVLEGELPQGLQEPEPPAERPRLDGHHRPLHQVTKNAVGVDGVGVDVGGHRLGRGQVEGTGEHRQPLEQALLRR